MRTIGDRICDAIDAAFHWLFAAEPWLLTAEWRHLGIFDATAFERPAPQRYCALIMGADGEGERTCEFEDCATLLESPVDCAARAVMDRLAAAEGPGEPLPYRIAKASRHGDFLMVQGVLGHGDWDFIAFASAA